MVASPGPRPLNTYKKQQEIEYSNKLRDIPIDELVHILDPITAEIIDTSANKNTEFTDCLTTNQEIVKYNTAIYDEELEDFILNQRLMEVIAKARSTGDHYSAEKVRVLRSARAVIYYAEIRTEEYNGI